MVVQSFATSHLQGPDYWTWVLCLYDVLVHVPFCVLHVYQLPLKINWLKLNSSSSNGVCVCVWWAGIPSTMYSHLTFCDPRVDPKTTTTLTKWLLKINLWMNGEQENINHNTCCSQDVFEIFSHLPWGYVFTGSMALPVQSRWSCF